MELGEEEEEEEEGYANRVDLLFSYKEKGKTLFFFKIN